MIFENYDRIVFAGDSITDMGRNRPLGEGLRDNLGQGYVRRKGKCKRHYFNDAILYGTERGGLDA